MNKLLITAGIAATVGVIFMSRLPRGIRNNNAGNIRFNPANAWQGQVGVDSAGFVIFDTPINGLRALARTLRTYREKHHLTTIRQVIERWAPETENNTKSYIISAENKTGIDADAELTLADYSRLVAAIIQHENGQQPYSTAMIEQGVLRGFA